MLQIHLFIPNRSEEFKRQVLSVIYDFDEQCARIIYDIMNVPFPDISIEDSSFVNTYNEHIKDWVREHPFMGKRKPANIVFESYILARMINNQKYSDVAYQYIRRNGTSYMFAYIYHAVCGFTNIDKRTLPYLYESLREQNNNKAYYSFEMDCAKQNQRTGDVECRFEFYGSNETMESYSGYVSYSLDDRVDLGKQLEHITISIPLDFCLSPTKVEATAPSYIKCRNLILESEELVLHKNTISRTSTTEHLFTFESEKVIINQKYNRYLQISSVGNGKKSFRVICEEQPEYPVLDFWESPKDKLSDLPDEMFRRYKKLRSIILEFRSHSKSELAKHHERIDFVLGSSNVGKAMINALLARKVMYEQDHLYILDNSVMDKELGLSYDGIRNFKLTDKVRGFLSGIEDAR